MHCSSNANAMQHNTDNAMQCNATWRSVGHDTSPDKSDRGDPSPKATSAVPSTSTSGMSALVDRWGNGSRSNSGRKSFSDTQRAPMNQFQTL